MTNLAKARITSSTQISTVEVKAYSINMRLDNMDPDNTNHFTGQMLFLVP